MPRTMIPATLISLLASASFAAAAATQQEADSVKASVEKYIGSTPGVITVTPNGDVYDFVFDPNPLAAKLNSTGVTLETTPIKISLKPLGGGKWSYDQNAPWSLVVKKGSDVLFDYKVEELKQSGVWDENLGAPAEAKYEATGYSLEQNVRDERMNANNKTSAKVASTSGEIKGTASTAGGTDLLTSQTMNGYSGQTSLTSDNTELMAFGYEIKSIAMPSDGKGFKVKELLALLAWGVAHPSLELAKQDQQTLKTLLTNAMPLFTSLKGDIKAADVGINTKMGNAQIDAVSILVDMNGAVKDGKFREAFGFKGLKLPASLPLPQWSAKLVPTESNFDFAVTGFDGEAAAKWAIDNLDLNRDPPLPADAGPAFLAKFAPQGTIDASLNPTFVQSPIYRIDASGAMKIDLSGKTPTGSARVTMSGFDETLKVLQDAAASDPQVQQVMGGLLAAKGFAKTEGEKLLWEFELLNNEFKINGVSLGKM
jgi:hypothetical protein